MNKFEGKVVLLTGASEGIGRALSMKFAEQGAKLVLAARNKTRLQELKTEIESIGGKALVVPTDITDIESCKNLILDH
ncbi:putative enzyme [Desulfamplus magnetovallimortis]|uniref:Putative enzyme n=1 Tax=Desulfamplus magnetovallimortis TaxID=1246637 RepID=A0A1W1HDQ0_9BACT|nr:SDR family NAD(P)-dependent oxidoreductase [Desulfamplus magnetovallimortis]SLM30566.1 putative enzyme [Desulfamplus magnetovallimortis]